jgi:hypothetical protein
MGYTGQTCLRGLRSTTLETRFYAPVRPGRLLQTPVTGRRDLEYFFPGSSMEFDFDDTKFCSACFAVYRIGGI